MGLLDIFGKGGEKEHPPAGKKPTDLREIAHYGGFLSQMVVEGLTQPNGKVIPQDAIALMAAIAAERVIDASGEIPLRDHELVPGSRFSSDKVNSLLFGDSGDGSWEALPKASVFGFLRAQLLTQKFQPADFPDLRGILKDFAARGENPSFAGTVPLTIPTEKFPNLSPLKIGFESRRDVDERLRPLPDRLEKLTASLWALMEILVFARQGMDPPTALRLAVEILHGMAKTAPMTQRRMDELNRRG